MNTMKLNAAEVDQLRVCALLDNAADVAYAKYEADDEFTQKWSMLAHFANNVAYKLCRIAPAARELCELCADEYEAHQEDHAPDVDCIGWWSLARRATRLWYDLSGSLLHHHGGKVGGQRVCDCAECDALEAARDLAGWIAKQCDRRVDHWSFDTYVGAQVTDNDRAAEEWWCGQMTLAGAPVECELPFEERQAA